KTLWHANIARVAEVGEAGGFLYLALDLAGAVSLDQIIRRAKEAQLWPLPPALAAQLLMPVLAALEYAHAEGKLFHREVSPEAIWLTPLGEVKLAGFGLERARKAASPSSGSRASV